MFCVQIAIKGFSLIELLVTLMILSILATAACHSLKLLWFVQGARVAWFLREIRSAIDGFHD